MKAHTLPLGEDSARYLKVIGEGVTIGRHVDLLHWLQGDVQHYLPHDILLAGWGDFQEGAIVHDIVSDMPGVRSYAAGTDGLPFLLGRFYDCWVAAQRQPCSLDFHEFDYLLGSASLPGSFCGALHTMRSALIHGLCDERSGHECLYVLLSGNEIPSESAGAAIRMLMPCIDTALRQMTHLPQQHRPASPVSRNSPEEVCGLSERETQIMAWVAMGKTNSEIGSILNISGFTVKNHMQRIFQKLNVFNRAQAVSKVTRVTFDG
jgi:transcriptional regulator EpsA